MHRSIHRAVLAAALAVGLAGCVNVLPKPNVPLALIELPADRAKAPAAPLRADVAVMPPDAGRAYSGVDIAVRREQELVYLADVRWADNAPRLLQGAVLAALSKAGGDGRAAPAQLGTRVDYDVRWRIIDLSTGYDVAPVRVEVEASLVDSRNRRMVAQERFSVTGAPASGRPRDRAAALAVAAQAVADQVAAFVAEKAEPKDRSDDGPQRQPRR
jgi:cholesterol transport system auxiliary component